MMKENWAPDINYLNEGIQAQTGAEEGLKQKTKGKASKQTSCFILWTHLV